MDVETYPYDSARYLKDDETIAAYMDEAFKTGDPAFITRSLGAVARARGMTRVAQEAGMSRESLYRALGEKGNPEFATVVRVMQAMGLRLGANITA